MSVQNGLDVLSRLLFQGRVTPRLLIANVLASSVNIVSRAEFWLRAERVPPVLRAAKLFPHPPTFERVNEYGQLFKFRSTIRLSFWHICHAIRFEQAEVNLSYASQMNGVVTYANARSGRHAYYLFPRRRVIHVRIA